MKYFRKIKLAVIIFALVVIICGSLYMTASAKKCLLYCKFHPVYECEVICF